MDIPAHVQTALAVGSPIDEAALLAAAIASPLPQDIFGLSPQHFTAAVVDGATGAMSFTVSYPTHIPRVWKYVELSVGGSLFSVAVCTPISVTNVPATAPAQSLVKAWLFNPAVIQATGVKPGQLVLGVASGATLASFASCFATEWALYSRA